MTPPGVDSTQQITPPHANHMRNLSQGESFMRHNSLLESFSDDLALRISSQVTVTTCSSDLVLVNSKMAPTKTRPTSASFATQQQSVRRSSFGSTSSQAARMDY